MGVKSKKCPKCGEEKPFDAFYKDPRKANGVGCNCKNCVKDAVRKRHKDNPEARKAYTRKWYLENRDRHRERGRMYRETNHETRRKIERRSMTARRDNNYTELRKIFGSNCLDCEREYPMPIYDYHHLDPKTKNGILRICLWTWPRVETYIQGCVQLCPTCHRLRHFHERQQKEESK